MTDEGSRSGGGLVGRGGGGMRHTPDQQAVVEMAQRYKRVGISARDANALVDLAKEAGGIGPIKGIHINQGGNITYPHIRIGPVNHIPVK